MNNFTQTKVLVFNKFDNTTLICLCMYCLTSKRHVVHKEKHNHIEIPCILPRGLVHITSKCFQLYFKNGNNIVPYTHQYSYLLFLSVLISISL